MWSMQYRNSLGKLIVSEDQLRVVEERKRFDALLREIREYQDDWENSRLQDILDVEVKSFLDARRERK